MKIEEIGVGLLCLLIYFGVKRLINKRKRRLFEDGISVGAEVLSVDDTGISIDSVGPDRPLTDVILRIKDAPFENRRVVVRQSFDLDHVPMAGDSFMILVDPKDPDNALMI